MARNFPEEVIIEILSWVPVKSLMRFKSVSKPWLHLISTDPNFIKLHFNRSFHTNNSSPGILVSLREWVEKTEFYYSEDYTTTTSDELIRFEIPFSHPHYSSFVSLDGICNDFKVVNVCNGLVCLTDFYQGDQSNVYVWNPLTGDYITLPCSPIPTCFGDRTEDGILYHEFDIMFGFGFNQAGDVYKVIRFVSTSPFDLAYGRLSHASVYTLGTDSLWRTLQQFDLYSMGRKSSTALVNGVLHWFGISLSESDGMFSYPRSLIAFNIQEENFEEIPEPDGMNSDYMLTTEVGVLGGMLSIICSIEHVYLEIWVMHEYGVYDSWRRLCTILHPLVSIKYDYLKPLGVADSGEIIICKNSSELISYDPNANSVKDLHRFEFQVFDSHNFKGTLLSPTVIGGSQYSQPHDWLDVQGRGNSNFPNSAVSNLLLYK